MIGLQINDCFSINLFLSCEEREKSNCPGVDVVTTITLCFVGAFLLIQQHPDHLSVQIGHLFRTAVKFPSWFRQTATTTVCCKLVPPLQMVSAAHKNRMQPCVCTSVPIILCFVHIVCLKAMKLKQEAVEVFLRILSSVVQPCIL